MNWLRNANPFRSLFGRILIWFWATLLIIMFVTSLAMSVLLAQGKTRQTTQQENTLLYESAKEILIQAYEHNLSITQSLALFNTRQEDKVLLIDSNYHLLGGTAPPEPGSYWLSTLVDKEDPSALEWNQLVWIGPYKFNLSGHQFTLVLQRKGNAPPVWVGWAQNPKAQTFVWIAISGILSLFLAWSLVRPLRILRGTSKQIAAGDLDARVHGPTLKRSDEIGHLAREFNKMASQVQKLLNAQQNLLANVSHELRSPLTRMQLAMGIMRKQLPDEALKKMDRLELEGQRLESLIGQLLSWSRLTNNMATLDREKLCLNSVVDEVVEDASIEADQKNLKLALSSFAAKHYLYGDSELMFSAINNLIRNAIRYAPEGSIIEINCRLDQSLACIEIADQGEGIEENELELIFEPFQRAYNTKPGGAGLGLSIAKEAVAYHNGSIQAHNRSQGGLSVEIQIPIEG